MHTVIIGNGILSLTTAFRLLQKSTPTDSITIIGPDNRPGSATLAAAAMLNSFAEVEAGSLDNDFGQYRFELSRLAGKMWPGFQDEMIEAAGSHLPQACSKCHGYQGGGCVDTGTYVINNTAADNLDDHNFDAILDALKQFDEPHELVSPDDIPNYAPSQKCRATRAVYIENEGWFNPRLVVGKLDAILSNASEVNIVNATATTLIHQNGKLESVQLDNGEIIAGDTFLLANGASISSLLHASELSINIQPVFYGVGLSIEIQSMQHPHRKCIRTPNRGYACGIYTIPYFLHPDQAHDHIIIGSTSYISPTPEFHAKAGSVGYLLSAAADQVNANFYEARYLRTNVGWRPVSQDTYPLLGKTKSIPNLVIATGTRRDGFHMSPILSDILSDILLDKPVDKRFEQFAPERKPIRDMTREQAVEKCIDHLVSAYYQHGYTPSQGNMDHLLKKMYRKEVEEIHDQVGATDWGIPPEMLSLYRNGLAR